MKINKAKIKKYLKNLKIKKKIIELKENIIELKRKLDKHGKKGYIVLGIILVFLLTTITFGRYIYNEIRDFYLSSKNFYFNSDKLTTNRAIYQVENWSAVDPYTITINLNNSKNNLVHTSSDINYEISYVCSSNVLCSVNSTGGTLYSSEGSSYFNAVMTPNDIFKVGDEAFIEITVKSTYPYKKTLRGRFILKVGKSGLSYTIDDKKGRPYFNFNITNTIDYYLVKEAFGNYSVNDRIDRLTYISLEDIDKRKCLSTEVTLTFDPEKVILDKYYAKKIVDPLLEVYINVRYYNNEDIKYKNFTSNINYYLRQKAIEMKENEDEHTIFKIKNTFYLFKYILYFDNVEEYESLKKVILEIDEYRNEELGLNDETFIDTLYELVKENESRKDKYLKSF
jgi:hypothetical protein